MKSQIEWPCSLICMIFFQAIVLWSGHAYALDKSEPDYDLKLFGKYVFFDKISEPAGVMGCVTCHTPETGGTNGDSDVNLHQVAITGANPATVGSLKPPSNAYASLVPELFDCGLGGVRVNGIGFCGGNFWNGRAEGIAAALPGGTKHIGDEVFQGRPWSDPVRAYAAYFGPTSDQALNPFVNPVEQNNASRQAVCEHVEHAPYLDLYEMAWGEPIDCSDTPVAIHGDDVDGELAYDISFKRIALAIGAWQHSAELNSFSSKRDRALRQELACIDGGQGEFAAYYDPWVCAAEPADNWGKFPLVGFTEQENYGHDLFYNTNFPPIPGRSPPHPELPVTNCSFCHLSDENHPDGTGLFERYADDSYHNIGIPVNPELPADPDPGISGHAELAPPDSAGGFRIPTLRNVDKRPYDCFVKAYGHNGWFKSLESIVHFYNTSQSLPRCETVIAYPGPYTEQEALANDCWPQAEWPATVATSLLLGRIGMTPDQEAAVVAYLKTLTDRETVQPPRPYHPSHRHEDHDQHGDHGAHGAHDHHHHHHDDDDRRGRPFGR